MSIYKQLCEKLFADLNTGVRVMKKDAFGKWVESYQEYSHTLKSYCTLSVPKEVFLHKYKSLPPIETIPTEEKIEWRKFVNEAFPGTTPEFRLDALKIIYTIGIMSSE